MIIRKNYIDIIITQINDEKDSIDILMYTASPAYKVSPDGLEALYNSLRLANNRGVKIRLLTDIPQGMYQFIDLGIDAKIAKTGRRMHAKTVIFSESAIVGSHNWSKMGLTHNDEISILTTDFEEVQELKNIFEEIWSES